MEARTVGIDTGTAMRAALRAVNEKRDALAARMDRLSNTTPGRNALARLMTEDSDLRFAAQAIEDLIEQAKR